MPELQELKSRRETTLTLLNLVRNVKAIAAVTIREQQIRAQVLKQYEETLEDSLGLVLRSQDLSKRGGIPGEIQGRGIARIVLGSDQGMCGAFNQKVASLVPRDAEGPLVVMGYRAARELEKRGNRVDECVEVPHGALGGHHTVGRLLVWLERWQGCKRVGEVLLYLNTPPKTGIDYLPQCRRLLPLGQDWLERLADRTWNARTLPAVLGPSDELLKTLIRQWLFITVYRGLADSLVAESDARLSTMQAAEDNIQGKLEELKRDYRSLRQSIIDAELLDISAGFEVITGNS